MLSSCCWHGNVGTTPRMVFSRHRRVLVMSMNTCRVYTQRVGVCSGSWSLRGVRGCRSGGFACRPTAGGYWKDRCPSTGLASRGDNVAASVDEGDTWIDRDDLAMASSKTVDVEEGGCWVGVPRDRRQLQSTYGDISTAEMGRRAKVKETLTQSTLGVFVLGGLAAVGTHYVIRFIGTLPVVRALVKRYLWWAEPKLRSKDYLSILSSGSSSYDGGGGDSSRRKRGRRRKVQQRERQYDGWARLGMAANVEVENTTGLISIDMGSSSDEDQGDSQGAESPEGGEPVEWVNMCWRKAWRVYQRGLERWLASLLQPVFDNLVQDKMVPTFVQRLKITEFTLDHEAPYFTNMKRRSSRKDSDLNGVVDVRYTGGARMVLSIDIGAKNRNYRLKVPVMVSDLDLECKLWLKLRLAPMCPYIGTISMAFVGPPTIKVQLSPYDRIKLMRIPVIQPFLTKLFTVDLPRLMTLPERLEIAIPPAVTAVAEAAIGRDAVMRAVASAVLQADALEHALVSALPLGPQGAAGGISLPDLFRGELQVTLKGGKDLPVWGFPWQSNPYCRLALGDQAVMSRKDNETSQPSRHRGPVWNQEFQFLVEDPSVQALEIWIMDSPMTGRTDVSYAKIPLSDLPPTGSMDAWFELESSMPAESSGGSVRLSLTYKPFQDDENDGGYREAAAQAFMMEDEPIESQKIIDIKSAADASSRAAVAASAAAAAVAVTKAAAARAAARLSRREETPVTEVESSEEAQQEGVEHEDGEDTQERKNEDDIVEDLSAMTETMHHLTDEVLSLHSNGNGAQNQDVVQELAKAESDAVSAMIRGDIHEANEVLDRAAKSFEKRASLPVAEGLQLPKEEVEEEVTGEQKAEMAITAAKAAALAAAAAMEDVASQNTAEERKRFEIVSDAEDSWGTDAIPSAASSSKNVVETMDEALEGASDAEQNSKGDVPWWSQAAGWVMNRVGKKESSEQYAAKEADGSAANAMWFDQDALTPEERRKLPVGDIVLGDDIPLEEIAVEVQKSWKQRDIHVERLVQKALEARQRESEFPLLLITSVMATSSAVLLSIVLYRLMNQ